MAFTPPIKRSLHARVLKLNEEGKAPSEIARAVGIHVCTVGRLVNVPLGNRKYAPENLATVGEFNPSQLRAVAADRVEPIEEPATIPIATGPRTSEPCHAESGDGAETTFLSDTRIRTMEDAAKYGEVDLKTWYVDRWECGAHETPMKLRRFVDGKVVGETPVVKSSWRVKLYLKRILPKPHLEAARAIFEEMKAYAPKYEAPRVRITPRKPHLCVMGLMDVHLGKLSWFPETGSNYDLRIADQVYRNAVIDLLDHAAPYEIDRFCLPIGNDFFHIDGIKNETTNGTPQDVDGRYAKIFETGKRAVVWAIEEMIKVAPVSVLLVSGNHDRYSSYCLAQVVDAWFHRSDLVEVDSTPNPRKKIRYGTNLLGFTHGNEEKHTSLPAIMATEWAQDWAETDTHEFLLGHFHRAKRTETTSVDTHDGVTIRTMMSLSGTDAWHHRRGFSCSTRAAEAYLYQKTGGYLGHFIAKARMSA